MTAPQKCPTFLHHVNFLNETSMDQLQGEHVTSEYIYIEPGTLKFLCAGKSGMIYGIDQERILKEYYPGDEDAEYDRAVERDAFARLGSHPNIVRFLGAASENRIVLERGTCLREVLQQNAADEIALSRKLCWLKGAAEGLRHMHKNGIVHADVGSKNMILVLDHLKLIDFEGSSIDGADPTSAYEWFSARDSTSNRSEKTDIFAFGSVMYEVITGKPPYHELEKEKFERRMSMVRELFAQNQFPEVMHLPLGSVMRGCWHGTYDSMSDVLYALDAVGANFTGGIQVRHANMAFALLARLVDHFWRRVRTTWRGFWQIYLAIGVTKDY